MFRRVAWGALVLVAGCSATAPAEEVLTSGYLEHYEQLIEDPDHPGSVFFVAEDLSLAHYEALLLEDTTVFPLGDASTPEEARRGFADFIGDEMRAHLGARFALADEPGPGVIRLRTAVTEADRATVVEQHTFRRGRASMEGELLDPDGKRLAAFVSRKLGGKTSWFASAKPQDAKAIADDWVTNLADWLGRVGLPQLTDPPRDE